jgi:DnaJ-class molecular chaperone
MDLYETVDLYEILQVSSNCTTNDIKKSYYKLAKLHHPDKMGGNKETFQRLNYAYNILIDEKSRSKYNIMSKTSKNKFIIFLEKWFQNKPNIKSFFNFNDEMFNNIENYDFNDILLFFNNNIIPNKKSSDTIDCSDSDIDSWDETQAEYYEVLPLKYHQYNVNNINLELKCSLDELIKNKIRKIKIKRLFFDSNQINTFNFNCTNRYIVFNMGGDIDTHSSGHLIINLVLPDNYSWDENNIVYNYYISLYQFIYGVDIVLNFNNKSYDIKQWIPYRDGLSININNINCYMFVVRLNIKYTDSSDKKSILGDMFME